MKKTLLAFLMATTSGCVTTQDRALIDLCYMPAGYKVISTEHLDVDLDSDGKADFCDIITKSSYNGELITITARHNYTEDKQLEDKPLWVKRELTHYIKNK